MPVWRKCKKGASCTDDSDVVLYVLPTSAAQVPFDVQLPAVSMRATEC